jgi:hypothetical protein
MKKIIFMVCLIILFQSLGAGGLITQNCKNFSIINDKIENEVDNLRLFNNSSEYDNFTKNNLIQIKTSEYDYINRERIIEIAETYVNHVWYPTEQNIYHGAYNGTLVDTPDRDTYTHWPDTMGWKAGEMNIGVPYKSGGFSSLSGLNLTNPKDFDEQYTGTGNYSGMIHFAGNINWEGSHFCDMACGVDCSGFVSRCWNLPQRHPTIQLDNTMTSSPIIYHELQKGDILVAPTIHVVLFKEFLNPEKTRIKVIHATYAKVHEDEIFISDYALSEDGFSVKIDNVVYRFYRFNYINSLPPFTPVITGPTIGKINKPYDYNLAVDDPENSDVFYYINWGDNSISEWIGPYHSGEEITVTHIWKNESNYTIRVKAKDRDGFESNWSDPLVVSMPKNKIINLFERFLESHPHMFPMMRYLLRP